MRRPGARQRRESTGGAANGIPLKLVTLPSALNTPATMPDSIFTFTPRGAGICAVAPEARRQSALTVMPFIMFRIPS
jgi:hypothetical protein